MKKTITTWLAGWMPVLLLTAQTDGLPSRVSAPMVVSGESTFLKSKGELVVSPEGKLKNEGTVTLEQALKLEAGESSAGLMENRRQLNLKNGVVFYSNDDSDGMLANFGTVDVSESNVSGVRLVKTFTGKEGNPEVSKYYYLSFPFDVDITKIKDLTPGSLSPELVQDASFLINKYNGAKRAESGNKLTWEKAVSIKADTAYAFILSNGRADHTIEFTASGKISSPYSDEGKTMNVPYHAIGDFADSLKCTGWNCIGNPYTSTFRVHHETTDFRGAVYFFNMKEGRYEDVVLSDNSTTTTLGSDFPIPPFTTIFTKGQKEGQETFEFKKGGISAAFSTLRSAKRDNRFTLKIASDVNEYSDKTLVLIGDDFTSAYKSSEDAFKMYSPFETAPCLWSLSSDLEDLSINQMSDPGTEEIRLGYLAGVDGNYTISLSNDQMDDYEQILLKDKRMKTETDLRESPYTFFVGGKESSADRFTVSFLRSSTDIRSAVENGRTLIYGSNGVIHVEGIEQGDRVMICDLTGRLVANAVSQGDTYLSEAMASGIYIVKIEGSIHTTAKVKN